ncbi:MAG TPA: NIPSNAP family protein [Candidatus Baltobacteraceae bacterium]|jgi:quinol monooxygenase YgiN
MSSVFELRRYTLHPGKRDALIDLFEREFVESQEEAGIRLVGQFRDRDRPDMFVWLRGFPDMEARRLALGAFYKGPVWKAHRDAANATMIDSDNVLLLRPSTASEFAVPQSPRAPAGATERPRSLVTATIYDLREPAGPAFVRFFEERVAPPMTRFGARPIAYFETETAENSYPDLPVRSGENTFVWFAIFEDAAQHDRHVDSLARSAEWNDVLPELNAWLNAPASVLRLEPTERSQLR